MKTGAGAFVFVLGLLSPAALAAIHYADLDSANPTPPYTSWATAATNIQDAIDQAASGDQVLVTNGVYQTGGRAGGDGAMSGVVITNPVTLQSANGASGTVIDGGGAMRCVYLADGAVLSGFTLRNGNVGTGGGAVRCGSYSNEVVANCLVVSNTAPSGGGIWQGTVSNSIIAWNNASTSSGGGAESCLLNNCILSNNTAGFLGGGASGGISTLNNCIVIGNRSVNGGGGVFGSTVNNCLVLSNTCPGGLPGGTYQCILNNCTICGNSAPGVELTSGFGLVPQANNCIIYYNSPPGSGPNVVTAAPLHNCCTTPLPPGTGNITNAPLFVNLVGGDFHLAATSPCINSGNNAFVPATTDLDGNTRMSGGTVDIGAYEFQDPSSLISYAWLQQYGLLTDGFDDFTDPDGDGMNNWQEWICGTNPTNATSVLKMLSPTSGLSGVAVPWLSVTNRSYFLQRATNLAPQRSFLTVATNIPGHLATTTFTDTNATALGPFFYRVGVHQ